jgi:hypothetical protein
MSTNEPQNEFLDLNGREVHAFASQMANLGFNHLAQLMVDMFKSAAWRRFKDGLGTYEFLPGEFDYFLTQQGVSREDVINGVRDLDTKALLEKGMDERRTGQDDYRRRLVDVREANPQRPGRPIVPFGYTKSEAKFLLDGAENGAVRQREPLGTAVRRYTNSGGQTSRQTAVAVSPLERVHRAALRLSDQDLAKLLEYLHEEQRRRGSVSR